MDNIEKSLQIIATKQALHAMIDEMGDDDQLVILREPRVGAGWFYTYGMPANERILWMVTRFQHYFLAPDCPNCGTHE